VPFAYEGVVRELIARAKYRERHAALGWLAGEMVRSLVASEVVVARDDVVTWAPTTRARRRRRGFDQAELLARAVARALGLEARALLRRDGGVPQTGSSAAVRAKQVRFRSVRVDAGIRVIVVDDVVTTGATLRAAASALRSAGAAGIVGLASARCA
jgi:ComF family protein